MIDTLSQTLEKIEWRQFGRLVIHRRIFRQLCDAWNRNLETQPARELWTFMYDGYVAFAPMAIRRMVDSSKDSVSVWNLLTDIKKPKHLPLVSRESFLASYGDLRHFTAYQMLNAQYDSITDGKRDLTPGKVDEHLALLKRVTDPVRTLVNKAIAHSDENAIPQTTIGDINTAVDTIAIILDKYSWLLRGRGIAHHVANVEKGFDMTEYLTKIWP